MTPKFVRFGVLTFGVVALMFASGSANAQEPLRRVLLLYPFDNAQPATLNAGAAVRKRLLDRSPSKIDIAAEFLDLARFPSPADELRVARYLADKHSSGPPDIIIPLNSEALRFATKYRGIIAPNVPIVFCCVTADRATAADRPKDFTPSDGSFTFTARKSKTPAGQ